MSWGVEPGNEAWHKPPVVYAGVSWGVEPGNEAW